MVVKINDGSKIASVGVSSNFTNLREHCIQRLEIPQFVIFLLQVILPFIFPLQDPFENRMVLDIFPPET